MAIQTLGFLVAGLGLLVAGAEALVRGATGLAARLGVSPLVIGLTIVAFGTSAPELAVSVRAAAAGGGGADIAIGNVVGSNIFNVLFILGACATLAPLVVEQNLIRVEVPVMIGVSALLLWLASDGRLSRVEGVILGGGILVYTVSAVMLGRSENAAVQAEYDREFGVPPAARHHWGKDAALVMGGLGLLVVGAGWLVDAATSIAREVGLSDLVIGLTIVAAGTSLPEVATSIVATLHGERDIAVGNVVGSNIFNVLAVLGVAAVVAPVGLPVSPAALRFDIPVMTAVAVACLPVFFTGHRIARWEGVLLLAYYAAYVCYLLLADQAHAALPTFSTAMMVFVVPLTAATLAVVVARQLFGAAPLPVPPPSPDGPSASTSSARRRSGAGEV